ncbi:MAG: GC-type dockerin domain-anchored protein [Phycisphaerales bacterium]
MAKQFIRRGMVAFLGAAGIACGAHAGGAIADGDAVMIFQGIPPFSIAAGDSTLFTDATFNDEAYKYSWYYRTTGNNTNRPFSSLDTPTETYRENEATFVWTNAGPGPVGQERFDARLIVRLFDGPSPHQVRVEHTLEFKSHSTTTQTFQVFNLVDMDLEATATNDTAQIADSSRVLARQKDTSTNSYSELVGTGASRFEVGTGTSLRNKLNSGSANLSNAVGPVNGDAAAAFQWTLTLAPGETRIIRGGFTINMGGPCPADLNHDGFVNGDDFDLFASAFESGTATADFNLDGFVNGDDFDEFASYFEGGC